MKFVFVLIRTVFLLFTVYATSSAQFIKYWKIVTVTPETLTYCNIIGAENGFVEISSGPWRFNAIKIPIDSIQELSAKGKANPLGGTIVGGLIGGVLGATLGGVIGASSHEDKGFMDFDGLEAGITGVVIGGVIGAGLGGMAGHSIASHMNVEERYNLSRKPKEEKIKILEEISRKK